MSTENRYLTLAVVGVLAIIMLLFSVKISPAHDHNHPELDGWFRSLHSKGGAWCCNGDDALMADWDTSGGHYRVKIDGEWVDVPEGAVVEGPNKVGEARVWPTYEDGHRAVRCFLPGSMI